MHDPDAIAPNGLTYREIDARQEDSVRRANQALGELRHLGARWWNYSVSHNTFDLIIGDPLGREDNIAICCPATDSIAGPIGWPKQQLEIHWTCDRESQDVWSFRLVDIVAGFELHAGMLLWRRQFDIHANGSIWFSARAPAQKHLEYLCSKCKFAAYGYHPYCAECGHKLPSEDTMFVVGLTRPVADPSAILQMGYSCLRREVAPGLINCDANE